MNLLQQLEQEQALLEHYRLKALNWTSWVSNIRNIERFEEQKEIVNALEETIRNVENALVVNWD